MTESARPQAFAKPSADVLARFAGIVGHEHALTDPEAQLPYLREWRDTYFGKAAAVLRPATTEQVSKILMLANETGVAIVPQAGNTGLVGGQVPFEAGNEVVVSVARLGRVRGVDAPGYTMTVESGITLAEAQVAADKAGRLFPLSLPSEGSCRIGGNLGTNAGGVGVLAYGNTRSLVLGLEVVLADGRILNAMNALKKDNTGYDLKDLFIGSEGTLGIITAAVLKLFPKPAEQATALVAIPKITTALELFGRAQEAAGQSLTAFEFIPRIAMEFVMRHMPGARDPFAKGYPWYVLIEISGAKANGTAQAALEGLLGDVMEAGVVLDATLAASISQARDLWRLREGISEAQKSEGGNIKHDVSVPIARIAEFVAAADAAVERICPGARPLPLGHFGDGNVHYNIAQPPAMDRKAFMALNERFNRAIHDLAVGLGGSFSAEHGIGRMKRAELARLKDPVALDVMRAIKRTLDPKGILNPGKVV